MGHHGWLLEPNLGQTSPLLDCPTTPSVVGGRNSWKLALAGLHPWSGCNGLEILDTTRSFAFRARRGRRHSLAAVDLRSKVPLRVPLRHVCPAGRALSPFGIFAISFFTVHSSSWT